MKNQIQAFRERYGVSQAQLALLVGVDARTVRRWENDEAEPSIFVYALLVACVEGERKHSREQVAVLLRWCMAYGGVSGVIARGVHAMLDEGLGMGLGFDEPEEYGLVAELIEAEAAVVAELVAGGAPVDVCRKRKERLRGMCLNDQDAAAKVAEACPDFAELIWQVIR